MAASVEPFDFKPFRYYPLSTQTSIRLLSIVSTPAAIHAAPTLCGLPLLELRLQPFELADAPNFTALSYSWGNPQGLGPQERDHGIYDAARHRWPVSVNGRVLYVARNLYEALSQFREDTLPRRKKEEDVDAKHSPYGKTTLVAAAEDGNLQLVERLIMSGADVSCQDVFGETALHYAAENGHLEVVQELLHAGASMDERDSSGRTPLDCCLQQRRGQHAQVEELLISWQDLESRQRIIASRKSAEPEAHYWIDALCVNQDDLEERSQQVAMMADLYGQAECVKVWLGIADDTTERGIQALHTACEHPTRSTTAQIKASFDKYSEYMRANEDLSKADPQQEHSNDEDALLSLHQVDALCNLLGRSVFGRTWVIQEQALARRVRFQCGPHRIDEKLIFKLFFVKLYEPFMNAVVGNATPQYGEKDAWQICHGAWLMVHIRFTRRPDAEEIPSLGAPFLMQAPEGNDMKYGIGFPDLLLRCWRLGASDPRDKVFALSHVVTSRGRDSVVSVRPDYRKTVAEVFAEAGRVFLEAKGDQRYPHFGLALYSTGLKPLEGLSYVQLPFGCEGPGCEKMHPGCNGSKMGHISGLPSWVPNFHWPIHTFPDRAVAPDASGGRTCRIYDNTPTEILKLDGYKIDTVLEVDTSRQKPLCRAVFAWLELVSRMNEVYPTGISRVEALAYTISGGSVKESESFKDVIHDFMLWRIRRCFTCYCMGTKDDKDTEMPTARHLLDQLRPQDHQKSTSSVSNTSSSSSSPPPESEGSLLPTDTEITAKPPPHKYFHEYRTTSYGAIAHSTDFRQLVRTANGYLGLSLKFAREGDEVWLLAGGKYPVLMRPVEGEPGKRTFVSVMYVHGVMRGEAVRDGEEFYPVELI